MGNPTTDGRMLRTKISDSDDFSKLSPPAAVLFCMIIPHLNSHGKLQGGPAFIKEIVCPKIEYLPREGIPAIMEEISDYTDMKWFRHDSRFWIHAVHFKDHQKLAIDKLGKDRLPDYKPVDNSKSGVSPELVQTSSGLKKSSPELVVHEYKDKVQVKEEIKAGPIPETPPVDNSPAKKTPFENKTDNPEENISFDEFNPPGKQNKKGNGNGHDKKTELAQVIDNLREKHFSNDLEKAIALFTRAYLKNSNYEALIHAFRQLHKKLDIVNDPDPIKSPYAYLEHIIKVESGNFNERDFQKDVKAKGPMASFADIARAGGILK